MGKAKLIFLHSSRFKPRCREKVGTAKTWQKHVVADCIPGLAISIGENM